MFVIMSILPHEAYETKAVLFCL